MAETDEREPSTSKGIEFV